jgi:hypothetical protein
LKKSKIYKLTFVTRDREESRALATTTRERGKHYPKTPLGPFCQKPDENPLKIG